MASVSSRMDLMGMERVENIVKMRYGCLVIKIMITTKNAQETKKVARFLAQEIRRFTAAPPGRGTRGAAILALSGELGAGKTTFTQGFAAALGVKEKIKSPTFVLMKAYDISSNLQPPIQSWASSKFRHFIHIDCYRLASSRDLLHLGFKEILKDKDAVILIEWADRIKKIIPRNAIWIRFTHGAKPHQRIVSISEY